MLVVVFPSKANELAPGKATLVAQCDTFCAILSHLREFSLMTEFTLTVAPQQLTSIFGIMAPSLLKCF
jgi:hypothetical protein